MDLFGFDIGESRDIFSLVVTATQPVRRMTHPEKRQRRECIAQAVKDGMTVSDAARKFGVTVRLVQMACQEFGVALSNGRGR